MIGYILFITICIVIIVIGYFKMKYRFWVAQPVFHIYDFSYMLFPPGIINNFLPERNKYTNFKNINTIIFNELTEINKTMFVNFISLHYLQNKDNVYLPKSENIIPYFEGHNDVSFISFYKIEEVLFDVKTNKTVAHDKIIGVMTSRPLHIYIKNNKQHINAYYVDYLCVDKDYRKKGIAPQVIQTHHYNQRHHNKKIVVSLFKREDELTGIVPLCVYSTYGFSIKNWKKPKELISIYKLVEINVKQNLHLFYDFLNKNMNMFDIVIQVNISNIIQLINTNNIYIYALLEKNEIRCVYFYRKSCIFIEKDMEVLSCFSSINNIDNDIFIQGFKNSFWLIKENHTFGFAAIENISHNNIIINNICKKTCPLIISPTAYFFYNFAYPTFNSQKVLIIN